LGWCLSAEFKLASAPIDDGCALGAEMTAGDEAMSFLNGVSGAFSLLLAFALALSAVSARADYLLGANLNGIKDFQRNHEFVDVIKQSRKFLRIGTFDDNESANLAPIGTDGWPTGDFRVVAMAAQQSVLGLSGTYKIIFNGRATVVVPGGGGGTISNLTFDAATNTSRADLNFPAGAENMFIDFTGTNGTVKNLRVIRPGFDPVTAPTFTPAFLNHVSRFPVLRFMDWLETNKAERIVTWNDRTTLEKLKTESHVARWETIVELANRINRDLWINIHVNANDEYVTRLRRILTPRSQRQRTTQVPHYVSMARPIKMFGRSAVWDCA
jgi:hypothetical protein